jgi:hypothetical protein
MVEATPVEAYGEPRLRSTEEFSHFLSLAYEPSQSSGRT